MRRGRASFIGSEKNRGPRRGSSRRCAGPRRKGLHGGNPLRDLGLAGRPRRGVYVLQRPQGHHRDRARAGGGRTQGEPRPRRLRHPLPGCRGSPPRPRGSSRRRASRRRCPRGRSRLRSSPSRSAAARRRAAVNFTASHNPPQYLGIKFSTSDGAPALPEVTGKIEEQIAAGGEIPEPPGQSGHGVRPGAAPTSPTSPRRSGPGTSGGAGPASRSISDSARRRASWTRSSKARERTSNG